jgi:hypothetical protein
MGRFRLMLALVVALDAAGSAVAWGATLEEIQAPPSLPSLGIGPPSLTTPLPSLNTPLPSLNTPLPSMEIGPPVVDTPLPAVDSAPPPVDTPLPPAGSTPEEPPAQPAENFPPE